MIHTLITTLFALAITFGASTTRAESYGFVGAEAKLDSVVFKPTVKALWGQTFNDIIGIEAFFLQTEGWAEAYIDPTVSITDGVTLGLSAGIESADGKFDPRFAGSVSLGIEAFSLVGVVEWGTDGDSDLWYKFVTTYKVTNWFKAGIELRRFAGVGPHLSIDIPDTTLSLWASWVPVDIETGDTTLERTLFGVKLGF